jgi:DnaK suppressor protein
MSIQMAHAPDERLAGFLPAWRSLLEARWQQRLITLTELSLAYHDAAHDRGERPDAGTPPALRTLLREATAARLALQQTEEALARLSAGRYGRCEQCSAPIGTAELLAEPETRYCAACMRAPRAVSLGAG